MNNNYGLFKQDEKNVVSSFNDCFLSIINFFKKQIAFIEKNNTDSQWEKCFDFALSEDDRNIRNIRDILDECIWLIQKHEPRANHLRLLISIINSLNDLKRMSSYVVTLTKFFVKNHAKINVKTKTNILKIGSFCLEVSNNFYSLIKTFNLDEMKEKSDILFDNFLKEYKKIYSTFIKEIEKKLEPSVMAKYIIVLKNIDRYIDHCVNIVENFVSIR